MRHYLDHLSTSPLRPAVRDAMSEFDDSGIDADPGRLHEEGRRARDVLEGARETVATTIGVRPRHVVLTSGATESINAAVFGVLWGGETPRPVAMAGVEHSAVRFASERLGAPVGIEVDRAGRIDPDAVEDAIERCVREHGGPPALVHCQLANHEVGTVQPVADVVERCHRRGVPVHVDAAAAFGRSHLRLGELGADLVSFSAHKVGGPTGIGALVVAPSVRLRPFIVGGDAERGRRAGLEPIRAAVGLAALCEMLSEPGVFEAEQRRIGGLEAALAVAALEVDGVERLGPDTGRLPGLVALSVAGVEAEPILLGLDRAGIAVHSGSSCSSESLEPSPVLLAMGVDADRSLRLSAGWSTTVEDADAFGAAFGGIVERLRGLRG